VVRNTDRTISVYTVLRDLNYQLKQLCRRNRDASYATRANRERLLTQIADQLHALGYRGMGGGH